MKTLSIGDVVNVNNAVKPIYKGERRVLTPIRESFRGQICGAKYLTLGIYNKGSLRSSFDGYEHEPLYLSVDEKIFVYLVRNGFINKEHYVLPGDLELFERCHVRHRVVNFVCNQSFIWDKHNRNMMREEAAMQPRDGKGRFIKIGKNNV